MAIFVNRDDLLVLADSQVPEHHKLVWGTVPSISERSFKPYIMLFPREEYCVFKPAMNR
jgi:hypothetical protein